MAARIECGAVHVPLASEGGTNMDMAVGVVLTAAVVLQLLAAILALRLIRVTGGKLAWGLVAVAIFLMVLRRIVPLARLFLGGASFPADLGMEVVGLIISACMFAGITGIGPLMGAWREAEQGTEHLNAVLRAIRNVNQLITREKDRDQLLQGICDCMVETRGYHLAWIVLFDQGNRPAASAQAGAGDQWPAFLESIRQGKLDRFVREALGPDLKVFDDGSPLGECCPLWERRRGTRMMTVGLEIGGQWQGIVAATVPKAFAIENDERELFQEAARDVAMALHGIQLEQDRARAERALRLDESRLEALLKLNQMSGASVQQITDFALEEAVRLTESKLGYLAFVNDDESVLTMHSWSKAAMAECAIIDKPIVYPVVNTGLWGEAVRQRKPVITNDYPAPNPWKKGHPAGHVHLRRHMNLPVFDGERMVIVAGVGNKEAPYDESDVRQLTLLMQGMWRLLQRKRAEESLQGQQQFLEAVMDSIEAGVVACNAEGVLTLFNRAAREFHGLGAEPIPAEQWAEHYDLHLPDGTTRMSTADIPLFRALGGEHVQNVEFVIAPKNGPARNMVASGRSLLDPQGRKTGAVVVMHDITALKRMAQELRSANDELELRVEQRTSALSAAYEGLKQERNLLHTLMDYLPHNIYFKDADSRFLRVNQAMAGFFKLKDAREAIGKSDLDFFTSEHATQAMEDEREILRTGRPVLDKEEKETWPDGHVTWAASTKMPLYDDAGRIAGTFGISRDITEQKHAAEALQQALKAAEAASRAKSDFLANMSHEIRTPLNAIIGMSELLLKTQLAPQQREYLSTVHDSGEVLLSVINDILDFSKIEAGKLVLENDTFDLRENLGDTVKSFAIAAHQQGLELTCFIHPEVPRLIVGDYNRLRQVIVNLVGNAIKFTEQGEVLVEVAVGPEAETAADSAAPPAAEGPRSTTLHFTVVDTGLGIPKEKQSAIFEMFEQVDNSITRRHGGTGLGLAIASRLAALMGGRIWVESEVGRGSRFHFTVRVQLAEAEPETPSSPEPAVLHGMRVLVVDDSATNRRILEDVLRSWSMVATCVPDARQAIARLREAHAAGRPYELVLTDAHMPEIDGFTLSEQIKGDDGVGSTVVMMLTSGDRAEDMARCEQLGIAAYLLKPIKQSELLEAIELALGITGPSKGPRLPLEERPCRAGRLRILLAEDSLVNQKLAVALLEGQGHTVTLTANGREALAAVESGTFDIVLMDVQMPEMDGLEATTRIRAREKQCGGHVPIVAMTAHALKGDRERCLAAGMDAYIAKPIRAEGLFDTIDALAAAPADPPAAPVEPDLVDWAEGLRALRGNKDLLLTVVHAALDEVPCLMAAIRDALAAGDAPALRLKAHTLKGSVRYFGEGPAYHEAFRIEELGRNGNLEEAAKALRVLESAIERLVPALRSYIEHESTGV
jgi:PAS domain S-box-containing protein